MKEETAESVIREAGRERPAFEVMIMDTIRTDNLTKVFDDIPVVDHVSFTVAEGELFSLLGTNGSGKSTIVKLLACVTAPTEGDAFVMEKSIRRKSGAVKKMVAVLPQEPAIAPGLSIRKNLELVGGVHGLSRKKRGQRIDELIESLDLAQFGDTEAGNLSGGWQRRLSIAIAMIRDPKLLIIDEPTRGLDVAARRDLWEIIRSLKGQITIVLSTQDPEEAESLADRIGVMRNAELAAVGTAEEIKAQTGCATLREALICLGA